MLYPVTAILAVLSLGLTAGVSSGGLVSADLGNSAVLQTPLFSDAIVLTSKGDTVGAGSSQVSGGIIGASLGSTARSDAWTAVGGLANLSGASRDSAAQAASADVESSQRVELVKWVLIAIAVGLTVLLIGFLWHTSPRRRMHLARPEGSEDEGSEDEDIEDEDSIIEHWLKTGQTA